MRKLVLPLAVLCILAFSTETFARCGKCRTGPIKTVVQAQTTQGAVCGATCAIGKVVHAPRAIVRGVRSGVRRVAEHRKCRTVQRPRLFRRCCR